MILDIRTYSCERCKTRILDHGEPGARFAAQVNCPKCRKPMSHSTAQYEVGPHPDVRGARIARKVA